MFVVKLIVMHDPKMAEGKANEFLRKCDLFLVIDMDGLDKPPIIQHSWSSSYGHCILIMVEVRNDVTLERIENIGNPRKNKTSRWMGSD